MTDPVTGVSPAPLPYRGGGGVIVLGVVAPVVVPVVETIPPALLQNSEKRAIFSAYAFYGTKKDDNSNSCLKIVKLKECKYSELCAKCN